MTVKELSERQEFSVIAMPEPEREVHGVYIGDLLSWVMGKASSDNAWITIMSNINVLAVASLCDVSTVILCEGVTLTDEIVSSANEKGVNVLMTELSAYEIAVLLS